MAEEKSEESQSNTPGIEDISVVLANDDKADVMNMFSLILKLPKYIAYIKE